MEKIFTFVKNRLFIVLFLVIAIGAVFGVKGAAVESKQKVGITIRDIEVSESEVPHPELIGIFPMAAEQNQFLSFKYAIVGFAVGIIASMVYLLLIYKFYDTKLVKLLHRVLLINNKEQNLFIVARSYRDGCEERDNICI